MSYSMNRRTVLFPHAKYFSQNSSQSFWRFPDHNIHKRTPFYRRQQAQPQAINKNATRNKSAPTGKIMEINIPAPKDTAKIPRIKLCPHRNMQLHLLSTALVYTEGSSIVLKKARVPIDRHPCNTFIALIFCFPATLLMVSVLHIT